MGRTTKRLQKASSTPKSPPPPPFEEAPSNLAPFLSKLSTSSVYITHVDRHPAAFKRQIFAVPVLLNFTIVALLLWRAYSIIPHYFSIIVSTLGYQHNETTIDASTMATGDLAWLIAKRAFSFLVDYLLVTIIWKWPITFFLETPHNPVSWRWKVGFRKEELIVRISRNWNGEDLVLGSKKGSESPFFKTRVLPALHPEFLLKTGYVMMNGSWDLDFGLMVEGIGLVDKDTIPLEDLDRKVFVWQPSSPSEGQWLIWDEKNYGKLPKVKEVEPIESTEGRTKILQIQDRLRALGKEDLFYKWVELIQYESTRPGGFTEERQLDAGVKVQALFEQHGVNFEDFENSVGGI